MVRSNLFNGSCLALSLALALTLIGCGDGGGGSGGSGGTGGTGGQGTTTTTTAGGAGGATTTATGGAGGTTEVALGDVDVNVEYAGVQTGTLNIAAVTSFPPNGPPVAFQSIAMPMFPQMAKLTGLEVGTPVYVVAVLDIGNNNPQSPGPEDLVAITMPAVDITADTAVLVNLTLMDK